MTATKKRRVDHWPDSRREKIPQLCRARDRRRAKNRVARVSRRLNRAD